MTQSLHLFIFLSLSTIHCSTTERGTCLVRNASGVLTTVCCADYEKNQSKCKPCATGFTSEAGKKCRPCPQNVFGDLCLTECNCDTSQRCDHQVGCVNIKTTESSLSVEQTQNLTENISDFTTLSPLLTSNNRVTVDQTSDFQTFSWLYKITTTDSDKSPGLSVREVIVYYTLSLAVVILMICLCVVIIKRKWGRKGFTIDRCTGQGFTERTLENNGQQEMEDVILYHEINETEMIDMEFQSNVAHNDYLEVVAETASSKSSQSDKHEQNSYLNPYQPLDSNNDTKSSYDKLHVQQLGASCNNDQSYIDVLDLYGSRSIIKVTMHISNSEKQSDLHTNTIMGQEYLKRKIPMNDQIRHKEIGLVNTVQGTKYGNRLHSVSNVELRKKTGSNAMTFKRSKTF